MKNTKRKHVKLCLLLLFMVLGCFAITNVRTTTVQASSRTFKSNGSGKKVIKTVKAKKNYAIAYMWVDSPHKVRYYTYRKSGFDAWKLKTLRF